MRVTEVFDERVERAIWRWAEPAVSPAATWARSVGRFM